jgi:hypothetical protein
LSVEFTPTQVPNVREPCWLRIKLILVYRYSKSEIVAIEDRSYYCGILTRARQVAIMKGYMNLNSEIPFSPRLKTVGIIINVLFAIGLALMIGWELLKYYGWAILGAILQAIDRAANLSATDVHFYILLVIVWVILGKLIRLRAEVSALHRAILEIREGQKSES